MTESGLPELPTQRVFGNDTANGPIGAQVRGLGRVVRTRMPDGMPVWIIACYATARTLLNDLRLGKDVEAIGAVARRKLAESGLDARHAAALLQQPHVDGRSTGAHASTRRRPAAPSPPDGSPNFTAARSSRSIAALLDQLPLDRPVDLIGGFAFDLPVLVIGELLGVPAADSSRLREWSAALIQERPEVSLPAGRALWGYLRGLIAAKRASLGDDLLSAMCEPALDGEARLSDDQLLSTAMLLLVAGHETTGNLIGNGIHWLLTEPERAETFRRHPETLPPALDELLRHDPPVSTTTMRFTREPLIVHGIEIPAGELVLFSLAAANRDPAQFSDPDTCRPGRDEGGHLTFGHGRHYCLGAPLARAEAEIALGQFIQRFPQARLAVDVTALKRRPAPLMNGFEQLSVRLLPPLR